MDTVSPPHPNSARDAFERRQRQGVLLLVAGPVLFVATAVAMALSPLGSGIVLDPLTAEEAAVSAPTASLAPSAASDASP